MKDYTLIKKDVLIIGGGGAALRAALAASDAGADTLIVSKGEAGRSGATYYKVAEIGAFNVPDGALDPTDSPDVFYDDIMKAAKGMSVPALSRIVADESIEALRYLTDECGMPFKRNADGSFSGYRACFSSKMRSHISEDHFGPLMDALLNKVKKEGLEVMNGVMITDFIVKDGRCIGAVGSGCDGSVYVFQTKSVIIATGGAGVLFAHNMYPDDVTGDGYAAAYRAGAVMANMEFLQAGLGLAYPVVNLLQNTMWEAMPKLTNAKGEAIIPKYTDIPEKDVFADKGRHFPFSCSDRSYLVETSIKKEIESGNANERGNVYLDFTGADYGELLSDRHPSFNNTWSNTVERYKRYGIDLYKDPIEICNFAHAINGGVLIDENAQSSIEGLFAVGEVAAGPHGADRLGGNMSVTCQVFGRRAGDHAGEGAAKTPFTDFDFDAAAADLDKCLAKFSGVSKAHLSDIRSTLQAASDKALLISRSGAGLESYLSLLDSLEKELYADDEGEKAGGIACLEMLNLITTGRLIAKSALGRCESRGSHYREDYPETKPEYDGKITKIAK